MDNEDVGRNFFNAYLIKDREGLISEIKMTKSSLFYGYVKRVLNDMSFQLQLDNINRELSGIFEKINLRMEIVHKI